MCFIGRKLHANADSDSDLLVDPPKVEEKLGVVPHGLSPYSNVGKRFAIPFYKISDIPKLFM